MSEVSQEDLGIVREYKDGIAIIEIQPHGGCKSCAMHGVCGTPTQPIFHRIPTNADLQEGDRVTILVEPGTRVFSSLVLFLLPIVLMLIFYAIAKFALHTSENMAVLASILSLLVSLGIIKLIDKRFGPKLKITITGKAD